MADDVIALGFTGSFGSGCTTFAEYIAGTYDFSRVCLSARLKAESDGDHSRQALQVAGNRLRESEGNDALAKWAVGEAERSDPRSARLVFDSIRHVDEVSFLRGQFKDFYLIAVNAPRDERWHRVPVSYTHLTLPTTPYV